MMNHEINVLNPLKRSFVWGGTKVLAKHVDQFEAVKLLLKSDIIKDWCQRPRAQWFVFERSGKLVKSRRDVILVRMDYNLPNKEFEAVNGFTKDEHHEHYHRFLKAHREAEQFYV
jgi:hypothetical protein